MVLLTPQGPVTNVPAISSTLALPTTTQAALAVADLDEDGILDLVVADGDSLRVLRGQGSGHVGDGSFAPLGFTSWARPRRGSPSPTSTVTASPTWRWRSPRAWRCCAAGSGGQGDGSLSAPVTFAASVSAGGAAALTSGDFNRDGILDLAASLPVSGVWRC